MIVRIRQPFWAHMSTSSKGLLMAAPLALILLSQMMIARSFGGNDAAGQSSSLWSRMTHDLKKSIVDRAAIDIAEDFQNGLRAWKDENAVVEGWVADGSGGATPKKLALFTPSLQLADYRVEFKGQIQKKALGWVVRASDHENYYAVKLEIVNPGLMPEVAIVRYPVIDGEEGEHTRVRLPMPVSADSVYHVALELSGDNVALQIQGQIVDSWSIAGLPKGGVGFFAGKGEQAKVAGLHLTHQTDAMGRLCAYFKPNPAHAAD